MLKQHGFFFIFRLPKCSNQKKDIVYFDLCTVLKFTSNNIGVIEVIMIHLSLLSKSNWKFWTVKIEGAVSYLKRRYTEC